MSKACSWGIGFAIVLIIAIVAVIFAVIIPGRKKHEDEELNVMYFAMHLGDPAPAQRMLGQFQDFMKDECSLDLNVENTRKSIEGLGSNLKYAFIFYSNDVDTTSPMTAKEALERLKTVKAVNESSYKQEEVAKAYTSRRNGKDLLVHFIPCDFSYSKDEDVKNFVTELQKSGVQEKILIVSNTNSSQTVAQLYEMNDENVAGSDMDIVQKIIKFGSITETTTEQTQRTQTSSTTKPLTALRCLLIGDVYNFGSNSDAYDQEREFISTLGYDYFKEFRNSKLGFWAYGHLKPGYPDQPSLDKMSNNDEEFDQLLEDMTYYLKESPMTTQRAIEVVNAMAEDDRVNCLVFFAAPNDTASLPILKPHSKIERIVAVGFANTDLKKIVGEKGLAIKVPFYYQDEDVANVLNAIRGYTPTTTEPTMAPTTTTTTGPKRKLNCLLVGDMYNYGSNVDSYEHEAELMSQVGYDVFASPKVDSQLGLWAYGYTKYEPDVAKTLQRMVNDSKAFNNLLIEMEYVAVASYKNTEASIKAINAMNEQQLDCLAFFTAQNNTKGLPKLEPKNKGIKSIVVVGLSGSQPDDIVPAGGKMISVPHYYLDGDVAKIVAAIIDNKPWTTKGPTTTTGTPTTLEPLDVKCLMVGDLYSFGANDDDRYLDEAEFIDALGYDFFGSSGTKPMAGVWAYGYTTFPTSPDISKITANRSVFRDELYEMQYQNRSDPLTTANAIGVINKMSGDDRVNCLVFFSASNDTKSLPKLNPQNKGIERIVAVGIAGADLNDLVTDRGVAVNVPLRYLDEHIDMVLKAILRRHVPTEPTKQPISTTRPSTTAGPRIKLNCLLVGDMYNYGSNVDSYEHEAELMSQVGYDVFASPKVDSQLGLWAYGYTKYEPDVAKTLQRMVNDSEAFNNLLLEMEYAAVGSYKNTEAAIMAINAMNEQQLDCLAFFTAQNNTKGLPKLEPKNKGIKTVVVVGLSGSQPDDIVPAGGKMISVPHYYTDGDVDKIVTAIIDDKPWTTKGPTTTTGIPTTLEPLDVKCLMVGDLYSFGANDDDRYLDEAEFIDALGYDFFESSGTKSMAGVWAYGYTTFPLSPDISKITANRSIFRDELYEMQYQNRSDPLTTANAIEVINKMGGDDRVNCLVFFSASNDTKSLPKLNPQNKGIERIVAVGFAGADLNDLVTDRGVALSVPLRYLDEHIEMVLKAILKRNVPSEPTTPPKSTTKSSTTAAPKRNLTCLLVGDMYNYESKADSYDNEAELMSQIGYDIFATSTVESQLGLWAYGYTKFEPDVTKTVKKLTNNSNAFDDLLMQMEYAAVTSYKNTEAAIKAINAMDEYQLNCLVFFTAQNNTKGLPKLEPKNKNIDTIVAVGLSGTNPADIVPEGGKFISVPYYYLDEDVDKIVKAITGVPWTTEEPTTLEQTTRKTTTAKPLDLKCLLVGDLYNLGSDDDKYLDEAEFISQLGYDFFESAGVKPMAGLWAYGYTTFPKSPDFGSITTNRSIFDKQLREMLYHNISDPSSTAYAIEVINKMGRDSRMNCLVFFATGNNTELLPEFVVNEQIVRLVAVGFDGANLSKLVRSQGITVSVPHYYLEEDVKKVLEAIITGKTQSSAQYVNYEVPHQRYHNKLEHGLI